MDGTRNYSCIMASITMCENKDAQIVVMMRREKEVLQLIAEDHINKEIAGKPFIRTTTVDTFRNNLLSKFDVKNTANLNKLLAHFNLI